MIHTINIPFEFETDAIVKLTQPANYCIEFLTYIRAPKRVYRATLQQVLGKSPEFQALVCRIMCEDIKQSWHDILALSNSTNFGNTWQNSVYTYVGWSKGETNRIYLKLSIYERPPLTPWTEQEIERFRWV